MDYSSTHHPGQTLIMVPLVGEKAPNSRPLGSIEIQTDPWNQALMPAGYLACQGITLEVSSRVFIFHGTVSAGGLGVWLSPPPLAFIIYRQGFYPQGGWGEDGAGLHLNGGPCLHCNDPPGKELLCVSPKPVARWEMGD